MTDKRDHRVAPSQDELARARTPSDERQDKSPFLRQLRQVQHQGVPEEGAVDPGPLPKPVRSGHYKANHTPGNGQGEKR